MMVPDSSLCCGFCVGSAAALDGDISPMHLYKATAMLMGFPSPVANVHLLAARTEASIAARKGAQVWGCSILAACTPNHAPGWHQQLQRWGSRNKTGPWHAGHVGLRDEHNVQTKRFGGCQS